MISFLELRHLIECGFLPLSCSCTVNPDEHSLTIKVTDPASGRVDLMVTAVSTNDLTSGREIAKLVQELRSEMTHRKISLV